MTRVTKEPEVRREELLDIAEKLFVERGFTHTAIRDIQAEASGSTGMFYHYFKSKEDVYQQVITRQLERYLGKLKTIAHDDTMSVRDRFKLVLEVFYNKIMENLSTGNMWVTVNNVELKSIMALKFYGILCDMMKVLIEEILQLEDIGKEWLAKRDVEEFTRIAAGGIYAYLNFFGNDFVSKEESVRRIKKLPTIIEDILKLPEGMLTEFLK